MVRVEQIHLHNPDWVGVVFQSGEDIYSNPESETKDFVVVAVVFVFLSMT